MEIEAAAAEGGCWYCSEDEAPLPFCRGSSCEELPADRVDSEWAFVEVRNWNLVEGCWVSTRRYHCKMNVQEKPLIARGTNAHTNYPVFSLFLLPVDSYS